MITPARLLVAALLILALGVRVWRVQSTSYEPINDAASYLALGSQISHSGDYTSRSGTAGSRGPTAYFPPAFPYLLAGVDLLDGHRTPAGAAVAPARLAMAALGTVAAALVGLVALEAFGPLVAVIALGVAAVYPAFVALSTTIYAENLLVVLELGAVWAALRAPRSASPYRWIIAAGLLAGLATLAHENAAVLVLALAAGAWAARRNIRAPALVVVAAAAAIAPWTIRNAVVLHRFIPVSDEAGVTLAGTYNPTSAADRRIPYRWRFPLALPAYAGIARQRRGLTEPQLSAKLEHAAFHYIGHHPSAPLAAAYHNTRRLLELEGSFAWRASAASIGVSGGAARIAVAGFWLVALVAFLGVFTLAARRAPRWLWITPVLMYLSVVFVNGETPRFRAPIDPFLILLAGCALARAAERALRAISDGRAPVGRDQVRAPVAGGSR